MVLNVMNDVQLFLKKVLCLEGWLVRRDVLDSGVTSDSALMPFTDGRRAQD